MNALSEDIEFYKKRISQLEYELEDMTSALTHAWDQLVPFLHGVSEQAAGNHDMAPIIQGAMAAVDAELGGIFLLEGEEWFTIPDAIVPTTHEQFKSLIHMGDPFQLAEQGAQWIFAPVVTEQQVVGALGVGVYGVSRAITAVDVQIVSRMAERAANQIIAAHLALSRQREAEARREMQIANLIQRSTQPLQSPQITGLQVASYWDPAKQVGGDAWGWVIQPDRRLTWFILDVAGKSLPAALAAVSLHTAIRMGLRLGLSPTNVLSTVNEEFYDAYTRTDLMATAAIFSIDLDNGVFEQANAGHPPTLIQHGSNWVHLEATAPPIGVLPDLYIESQRLALNKDDILICYSDGFSEIETPLGLWGEAGILAALPDKIATAQMVVDDVVKAAQRVRQTEDIHDDQTLIVVRLA